MSHFLRVHGRSWISIEGELSHTRWMEKSSSSRLPARFATVLFGYLIHIPNHITKFVIRICIHDYCELRTVNILP